MASRTAAPTAWHQYQATVLARTDLTPNLRHLFKVLASEWANYKHGGNCAPSVEEIAERCGWSHQWTARLLRQLRALGIIETIPLRTRSGRWNRNGYRFVGHGFASPRDFDTLDWLRPSATPRQSARAHDRATGRFACGPKVTTGCGPKVTTGADACGPKVTNQTLQLTADSGVDLGRAPTAPMTNLTEAQAGSERKIDDAWLQWWESQCNEGGGGA